MIIFLMFVPFLLRKTDRMMLIHGTYKMYVRYTSQSYSNSPAFIHVCVSKIFYRKTKVRWNVFRIKNIQRFHKPEIADNYYVAREQGQTFFTSFS